MRLALRRSSRLSRRQAEGFESVGIGHALARLAGGYAKLGCVVPHAPADVVSFQGFSGVLNAAVAIGGRGLAIHAELVARQRNAVRAFDVSGQSSQEASPENHVGNVERPWLFGQPLCLGGTLMECVIYRERLMYLGGIRKEDTQSALLAMS